MDDKLIELITQAIEDAPGFPCDKAEAVAHKIQAAGYRVVPYDQIEMSQNENEALRVEYERLLEQLEDAVKHGHEVLDEP